MVKNGVYYFPDEEHPIVASDRAMRFCGCSFFVGIRLDNKEPAAVGKACSKAHSEQMDHAFEVYRESMDGKRPELDDLPAIEAADIVLHEAFPA